MAPRVNNSQLVVFRRLMDVWFQSNRIMFCRNSTFLFALPVPFETYEPHSLENTVCALTKPYFSRRFRGDGACLSGKWTAAKKSSRIKTAQWRGATSNLYLHCKSSKRQNWGSNFLVCMTEKLNRQLNSNKRHDSSCEIDAYSAYKWISACRNSRRINWEYHLGKISHYIAATGNV